MTGPQKVNPRFFRVLVNAMLPSLNAQISSLRFSFTSIVR